MTEDQIKNTLVFLTRTQLQGSEVQVFNDCVVSLQNLLTPKQETDDTNKTS